MKIKITFKELVLLAFCLFLSMDSLKAKQPKIEQNYENYTRSLSFKKAFEELLKSSYSLEAKKYNSQKQEKILKASLESFLPDISINAAYLHFSDEMRLDPSNIKIPGANALNAILGRIPPLQITSKDFKIASLNLIYPLYLGGKRLYLNKAARLGVDLSLKELDNLKLKSFSDLVAAYYAVLLNKQLLKTFEEMSKASFRHLDNAKKLRKAGLIPNIVQMQADVAYKMSLSKNKLANTALKLSKAKLKNLLNMEDRDILLSDDILIPQKQALKSEAFYISLAMNNSPLLKSIELRRAQGEQLSKSLFSDFLPKLSLLASAQINDKNSFVAKNVLSDYVIGLGFSWNLLSPTGKIGRYEASRAALLEAASLEQEAKAKLRLMARAAYKEIIYAHENYLFLATTIDLARENLRVNELAFKQGVSTEAAVDDARAMLQGALLQRANSAYKYIVNLGVLAALCADINIFYEHLGRANEKN